MNVQAPTISGAAIARRGHDAPASPPSRNEKIWRRSAPETYIAIVSRAASTDPTAYPVSRSRVSPPDATGAAEPEHDVGGQQRARERQPVQQPELEDGDLDRDQDRHRGPERGPRGRPEHVRIGQRVPEQPLERGARDREPGPDDHRGQDARQSQVPDDRLGRRRPVETGPQAQRPPQDHPDGLGRADLDGPQADAEDDGDDQDDESRDADHDRPTADPGGDAAGVQVGRERAGRHVRQGAGGKVTSGRIVPARLRSPTGRRGPGRVISMSSTVRTSSFTTAVMTLQPGRAATASGVGS